MDYLVILITAKDRAEAEKIGATLVGEKLAACANIVPGVSSIFCWENNIQKSEEVLMIVKTRKELYPALQEAVRKVHSYKVPEIIALPIVLGYDKYLDWIGSVTD
jgi:periplasmic divalent cation tolerance protein